MFQAVLLCPTCEEPLDEQHLCDACGLIYRVDYLCGDCGIKMEQHPLAERLNLFCPQCDEAKVLTSAVKSIHI